MPTATRDAIPIHYEDTGGGGPVLLLLNGLTASAYLWPTAWTTRLSEDFRVVAVSNRGTGLTPAGEPFTLRQLADDAVEVLDEIGAEHAHVLGFSMGGMIALTLTLEHADRVRSLVLCSTSHGGVPIVHPDFAAAAGDMMTAGTVEGMGSALIPLLGGPGFFETNVEIAAELAMAWQRAPTPFTTVLHQMQAVAAFDVRERVGEIAVPTLVMHGDADRFVMFENGPMIAEAVPGARFVAYEGVGHLLPFETGLESATVIAEFLTGAT